MRPFETSLRLPAAKDAFVLISAVASNVLSLALPVAIMQTYDRVIPSAGYDTFQVLIVALLAALLLDTALGIARGFLLSETSIQLEHLQTLHGIDRLANASKRAFSRSSVTTYLHRLAGIEQMQDYNAGQSRTQVIDAVFALVNLLLIWLIAGTLVVVPLIVVGGFVVVATLIAARLRRLLASKAELEALRQDFLVETMTGIHLVRSMAVEAKPTRREEAIQGRVADNMSATARTLGLLQSCGIYCSQLIVLLFVAAGAGRVLTGDMSVGALAAGTMLAGRVLQPLLRGVALWAVLQRIGLARSGFMKLLDLEQDPARKRREEVATEGHVVLHNVSFAYEDGGAETIRGVDLDIRPGEAIGLCGANGSGRTTLLELIKGSRAPSRGWVQIDGLPAALIDRESVALLPQRGALFQGSLLDNLTLGRPPWSAPAILAAAETLGLSDAIRRLPLGLDTPVITGDAMSLPNGLKQQVLIARNMGGDPRVILVDEANSSMDHPGDARFVELLTERLGNTTLVINTHRPSLLNLCDRVFEMKNGQLHERQRENEPDVRAAVGSAGS